MTFKKRNASLSMSIPVSVLAEGYPYANTRNHAFSLRGGAITAKSIATGLLISSEGGNDFISGGSISKQDENVSGLFGLSFQASSVLYMAIAMSLHYLGYSFARPTTLSLFTSERTGYAGSPAAFTLAMAFVSPTALLLLMGYGQVLERYGPRGALTRTTLFCSFVLCSAALLIIIFEESPANIASIPIARFIVGPLFVFRESYVALLTSQYWSFISSVLTPSQSAVWFAPISGLTSITSALAGMGVSSLVEKVGLPGAIVGTAFMLVLSLVATNAAYKTAEEHGFNPADEHKKKKSRSGKFKKGEQNVSESSMITKASRLFKRVPQLGALFLEILSSQGLATLLNVCFVTKLSSSVPVDTERAGWMGKFFALINILSMCLQFGVLPRLMTFLEPRVLWRAMPLILMCFTSFQSLQDDPSLYVVSGSLLVMKTLEYSARRMLDEMVYVPLDFESRYVGKEVIGVFGYRFGKSTMSLGLWALTSIVGNLNLQELSFLTSGASIVWLAAAWNLSSLIPSRKEAEETYNKKTRKPH